MSYLDVAKSRIAADEGCVLHAYMDDEGFWTLGIGRLIDKRKGGGISNDEAMYLLDNDLRKHEAEARALFPSFDTLSDNRKAVLISMAFQLGGENLAAFHTMRTCIAASDFDGASAAMLDSRWAKETPERAKRLSDMMKNG